MATVNESIVRISLLDVPQMRAVVAAAIDLLHAVESAPDAQLVSVVRTNSGRFARADWPATAWTDAHAKAGALREALEAHVIPGESTRDPLSDGQRRAFYAKCSELERRNKLERNSMRVETLAAASLRFDRVIESVNDLSSLEASVMLDWLEEELRA